MNLFRLNMNSGTEQTFTVKDLERKFSFILSELNKLNPESIVKLKWHKEEAFHEQGVIDLVYQTIQSDEEYLSSAFENFMYQQKYKQLIDLARELNVLHE